MNLGSIRKNARVILITLEVTFRQYVADAFIIFTILVQPLVIATMAFWMLREKGGDIAIFVVIGSGMTGLWSSALFISGNSINHERWSGTLETLVGQPTPLPIIIFGKNLAHVIQSFVSMLLSYFIAYLLFGYSLHIEQPLLFFGSLVLTVISFVSFGLIIGPIFVMNPGIQSWQNAMEFPIYILSGFLFPIALLPDWTTPVSFLLAPFWAARALQGSASGNLAQSQILFSWLMMGIFSGLYIVLSRKFFQIMLRKTRVEATLDVQ